VGSTGYIDACITKNCFAEPSIDLWTTISYSLAFNDFDASYLQAQLAASGLANGSPVGTASYTDAMSQSTTGLATANAITATSLGFPTGSSAAASVDSDLGVIRTSLSTAISLLNSQEACATPLANAVLPLTALAAALIAEISNDALTSTFQCSWWAGKYDPIFEPATRGSARNSFLEGGGFLALATAVGFFGLIPFLICVQIRLGRVGRRPGCCCCCRNCCLCCRMEKGAEPYGQVTQIASNTKVEA